MGVWTFAVIVRVRNRMAVEEQTYSIKTLEIRKTALYIPILGLS